MELWPDPELAALVAACKDRYKDHDAKERRRIRRLLRAQKESKLKTYDDLVEELRLAKERIRELERQIGEAVAVLRDEDDW